MVLRPNFPPSNTHTHHRGGQRHCPTMMVALGNLSPLLPLLLRVSIAEGASRERQRHIPVVEGLEGFALRCFGFLTREVQANHEKHGNAARVVTFS